MVVTIAAISGNNTHTNQTRYEA